MDGLFSPAVMVFHATFESEMTKKKWEEYLELIPIEMHAGIFRYHRWQDRHCSLISRLLLRMALQYLGLNPALISDIKTNDFGRPYLDVDGEFNVSHSGNHVVCAVSANCKLGVDIEEIKTINFEEFQNTMTRLQWDFILKSGSSMKSFYRLWTLKESVIKADGRGLSIPLTELETDFNTLEYDSKKWFLTELPILADYAAYVATNFPHPTLEFVHIRY